MPGRPRLRRWTSSESRLEVGDTLLEARAPARWASHNRPSRRGLDAVQLGQPKA